MRRKLSYSNVIATVALFVALGGSAYAALRITGRDVVNGSLTGNDIKKRSVPLNRLRGKLPSGATGAIGAAGPQGPMGAAGPQGEAGPPGPIDESQFIPSAGMYEVSVGPTEWISNSPSLPHGLIQADRVDFTSTSASGTAALGMSPAIPSMIAGKATRLRAAVVCWDATDANILITAVYVTVTRGPLTNSGQSEVVGENADENDHNERTCKRYDLNPFMSLSGAARVSVRASVGWQASSATLIMSAASFEFDRVP